MDEKRDQELTVGQRNLEHVLENDCQDPDCELHNPDVIEDSPGRWTAKAHFLAGALAMREEIESEYAKRGADKELTEIVTMRIRERHYLNRNWP